MTTATGARRYDGENRHTMPDDRYLGVVDTFLVTGKVALVTGAGDGIGQETALVLAAAGAHVIATDVDDDGLRNTLVLAGERGISITTRRLDITDPAEIADTVEHVVAEHDRLDILVNAAGVMIMRDALEVTPEELDRVLRINVGGTFFACQAAARVMTTGASIVNLSSSIQDRSSPGRITYAISKGGVAQLTRTLALELGPAGIRVNAIAPGWVETGMTRQHWTHTDGSIDAAARESYLATMASASPLSRVGTTRDIALSVLQLASDAGAFITGQVVRVNGGSFMA
ncbi:SDR family oxidoreductase [Gordonia sp. CPCC 206044]|uniref:SDR family NAD(P)-dependent oxidoreductase n=1 Tax=Gordonia sp. CPCC 206044 TaxID=3140793 RepID=UPI003AF345F5